MTRRRWGKAGTPLTAAEAANLAQRKHQRAVDEQRAYREWRAGNVVPYRITLALDFHGLQGPDVDEACGVHEPQVDMWEAGTLYPTWDQLRALAELTGNTPGFFMHQPHADLPLDTSLRFHRIGGQKADWRQPPPIRTFLPEAITATVAAHEGAPVEPPRIEPEPRQPKRPARQNDRHISPKSSLALVAAVTHEAPRLDRTGDPEPPDGIHRPGIDCAGGWQLGHTLDDDEPRPCLICKPHLRPERRQAQVWGGNPDARPRDPSCTTTRPVTRENAT